MIEKISITIEKLDDMDSVLKSIELLFRKLILYYSETDLRKLTQLILSCSNWFGAMLKTLGYTEEDFKE